MILIKLNYFNNSIKSLLIYTYKLKKNMNDSFFYSQCNQFIKSRLLLAN